VKNSFSTFSRVLTTPGYRFDGRQVSSFTEINYDINNTKTEWVAGVNLWTDSFKEDQLTSIPLRDYELTTFGIFLQNNLSVTEWLSVESGVRTDYVLDYGLAVLPRVSALFNISEKITSRIGGGFGYKPPTIFTEESERIQYEGVLPIDKDINELEKSYGVNWDVNYITNIFDDAVTVSINQLFFYTFLDHPLFIKEVSDGIYQFQNLPGHIDTQGKETNVKIEFSDFKIFLGYTFTDTRIHSEGESFQNPLTPKHRVNSVLMYEVEDKWKIGAEGYYFGQQKLNDGTTGRDYWICGLMLEKLWERFSLYINFENYLDTRQTRFDTIYTGPITNPVFKDIYAPLDGFVINGGIKISL
jgi:iron complex outermembrane receptor protein